MLEVLDDLHDRLVLPAGPAHDHVRVGQAVEAAVELLHSLVGAQVAQRAQAAADLDAVAAVGRVQQTLQK